MVMVPLRNIGAGGLVPDQQPYDVELTQFAAGNNVQMFNGRLGKSLGHVDVTAVPNAPTHVAGWFVDGNNTLVIGTANNLYRYAGSSVVNVTAAAYTSGYANSPAGRPARSASASWRTTAATNRNTWRQAAPRLLTSPTGQRIYARTASSLSSPSW